MLELSFYASICPMVVDIRIILFYTQKKSVKIMAKTCTQVAT